MMIRDNEIHPPLARDLGRLDRRYAAINGDDQLCALVADLPDRVGVQAVPLFDPMRDVILDVPPEHRDGVPEDARGGDAVDVIVAVDEDPLAIANGLGDPL